MMSEWLYGAEGYYRRAVVGKQGDFYTSVSTGRYFGSAVGNLLTRFLEGKPTSFVEIGAAGGELIVDSALYLWRFFPQALELIDWVIIEPLEENRARQRAHWEQNLGAIPLRILPSLEVLQTPRAFYVANELLDAFPCELYKEGEQAWVSSEGAVYFASAEEAIKARAQRLGVSRGELAVGLESWVESLARAADSWLFLSFDYGQDFARNDFSIRLYQGHEVMNFADFKEDIRPYFGVSDLTYDVNFAEVATLFEAQGARQIYYNRQNRALVEMGLGEVITRWSENLSGEALAREMMKVRPLLDPSLLGERFKAVCFAKGALPERLFWLP